MDEAERLGFPLFEVPYEMPFIAITEKAFARLVNEQYEVLQRGIAVHRRLEQLVLEQRGLDEVARALSAAIGGTIVMLDWQGEEMAAPTSAASCRAGRSTRSARRREARNQSRAPDRLRAGARRRVAAARSRCRSPPSRRAGRARGSWRSATPAASASSSG